MTYLLIAIFLAILIHHFSIERCEVEGCKGIYLETSYDHIGQCDRCGHEKNFRK